MDVCYTRCAGLDVHKQSVVACRIETQAEGRKVAETRTCAMACSGAVSFRPSPNATCAT